MKTQKFKFLLVLFTLVLVLGEGCYYDYVIFPDGGEFSGDVSFATDLVPVFEKSCSITGCHNTGGQKPDLSPANAYDALYNGNYINTQTPEESDLYLWMKGLKALPMPPSGTDVTNTAKVLAWIKQGALNN